MIKVLHINHEVDRNLYLAATFPIEDDDRCAAIITLLKTDGGYTAVATINTDDFDLAYALTQNHDNSWSRDSDPRITVLAELPVVDGEVYGLRSSMIGDVFLDKNDVAWFVDTFGFSKLTLG